jgi:hypothetical protein
LFPIFSCHFSCHPAIAMSLSPREQRELDSAFIRSIYPFAFLLSFFFLCCDYEHASLLLLELHAPRFRKGTCFLCHSIACLAGRIKYFVPVSSIKSFCLHRSFYLLPRYRVSFAARLGVIFISLLEWHRVFLFLSPWSASLSTSLS